MNKSTWFVLAIGLVLFVFLNGCDEKTVVVRAPQYKINSVCVENTTGRDFDIYELTDESNGIKYIILNGPHNDSTVIRKELYIPNVSAEKQ